MILDFYGSFCDKNTSVCHTISPYHCDYPKIKYAYAESIQPLPDNLNEFKSRTLLLQIDVLDKFRRFIDGIWSAHVTLNNKYEFEFKFDQTDHRDLIEGQFDATHLNLNDFSKGIDVHCNLLLNNEIVCPLSIDVVIITEE